jgi:hypothetical protein
MVQNNMQVVYDSSKAFFGQSNSAEGRALVPLLIFPYRVIKCVTIAKN